MLAEGLEGKEVEGLEEIENTTDLAFFPPSGGLSYRGRPTTSRPLKVFASSAKREGSKLVGTPCATSFFQVSGRPMPRIGRPRRESYSPCLSKSYYPEKGAFVVITRLPLAEI